MSNVTNAAVNSLIDTLTKAVQEGASVQQGVNAMIDDGSECDIPTAIGLFRTKMEDWITLTPLIEDQKTRRKSVNNIINDVSRIMRNRVGKSLVCVKRKPVHRYELCEPKPRTTNTHATITSTPSIPIVPVENEEKNRWTVVREACRDKPESVMVRLFEENEDWDELAQMFLRHLREAKANAAEKEEAA